VFPNQEVYALEILSFDRSWAKPFRSRLRRREQESSLFRIFLTSTRFAYTTIHVILQGHEVHGLINPVGDSTL
jgi:hypothetical protein